MVRVKAGEREIVYSLTLPEVGDAQWTAPVGARKGIPARSLGGAIARDVWQWLAAAGALLLAVEWMLYGRGRSRFVARANVAAMRLVRGWSKAS